MTNGGSVLSGLEGPAGASNPEILEYYSEKSCGDSSNSPLGNILPKNLLKR
jgi:hypothetical protein